MRLTQKEFKILMVAVGLIIGVAVSLMAFSMTHNYGSFILVPVCALIVYFQQVRPLRKSDDSDE